MRKLVFLLLLVGAVLSGCSWEPTARQQLEKSQEENAKAVIEAIGGPPKLDYFQEAMTQKRWYEYWNKPSVPAYTYIFVGNYCIGYFVTEGKPASTQSYIYPEQMMQKFNFSGNYSYQIVDAPDLDGTYGKNNPGIHFFLPDGNPVEFAGANATYIYSGAPLNIDAPKLIVKKDK